MTIYIIALVIIMAVWVLGVKNKENHLIIGAAVLSIIVLLVYGVENFEQIEITQVANDQIESLYIHTIDVGQGDATLIQYGDVDILIDAGPNKAGEKVVEYLQEHDVDDLELVIATHAHEDHIGGLDNVLYAFDVERVIDSGEVKTTKTYADYLLSVKEEGCEFSSDENEVINFDEWLSVEIIDVIDDSRETNDNSVIAKVSYGKYDALFCGDAEEEVEDLLMGKDIRADIFKASHHGSNTSNNLAFISKISPKYVIISAGEGNKYGHPKKSTVGNFLAFTEFIYGTWISGDIVIEINKNGIIPEKGLELVK